MDSVGMGKQFSTKTLVSEDTKPTSSCTRSEGLTLGVCKSYMVLLLLPRMSSAQLVQHISGRRLLSKELK
eukprot:8312826-Karenia_brevis.AAC.1